MDDIKPAKFPRRDFRNQIIAPPEPRPEPHGKKPHKKRRLVLFIVVLVLIIGAAGGGIWYRRHHTAKPAAINTSTSPVPKAVAQAVNFPIYYPDGKKLPTGYFLDRSSFKNVGDQAVIYSISFAGNKKLRISEQAKPSDTELANFNSQYIPIHRQVLTPIGTATVGSINNQTVVSLPSNNGTWIIITGPPEIYASDQFSQVIQSITKLS